MASNRISEKSIRDFLMVSLFGEGYNPKLVTNRLDDRENKIDLAIKRAYRDMNRTLRTKEHQEEWDNLKDVVILKIKNSIKKMARTEIIDSQESYDKWFDKLIEVIIGSKKVIDRKIIFKYKYGQAQKWANMTMKYLVILKYKPIFNLIPFLHVPIDEIIVNRIVGENSKEKSKLIPWSSKLNPVNYYEFQQKVRDKFSCPMAWEINIWNMGSI